MADDPSRLREKALRAVEVWLRNREWPRFHMLVMLALTGAAGFLFSFLMLKAGTDSMAIRYPFAVALSYLVFLLLLRVWMSGLLPDVGDACGQVICDAGPPPELDGAGGEIAGEAAGALDFDELVLVLIVLAALCAGLAICLYIVWTAPALLAEVLVDGVVMTAIYRKMRVAGGQYWVYGALRRTWIPAVVLAGLFAIAGYAMLQFAPHAHSIGQFVSSLSGRI